MRPAILFAGLVSCSAALGQDDWPGGGVELLWSFVSGSGSFYQIESIDAGQNVPTGSITVWVMGEHSRDRSVAFRRSLQRVTVDCSGSFQVTAFTSYMPDDSVRDAWDRFGDTRPVQSDPLAQSLEKVLCRQHVSRLTQAE